MAGGDASLMRPVVYSASSVNAYQICHLQWWFSYVAAIPTESSEAQAVGIAVHDQAERILRRHETVQPTGKPDIDSLVAVFLRDVASTYGDPILVEEPFQIEVNGIPFSGVIDALDESLIDGEVAYTLRDLKTTSKRPATGKYRFNMIGYYLGAQDLGYDVNRIQLDYIVRTQRPYYWPEVQPTPDPYEIIGWADTLARTAEDIEVRENFEPTGLGTWACGYCNFASMCGPYQRYREGNNG